MSMSGELGRTLGETKKFGEWKSKTKSPEVKPIGIKTPLEKGTLDSESLFKMHFNIVDQIKDNLKNLIMTQKGERLGFPDYGTRLRAIYSNTSITEDQMAEYASLEIKNAVESFMPNISLLEFYSNDVDKNNFSLGNDFLDKQASTNILSASSATITNKDNPDLNKIHKITIKFSIPLLGVEESDIVLFVNNAI